MPEQQALDELLLNWQRRVTISQSSHYACASYFGRLNYALGIPAVVLSTFVGTSVFATLQKDVDTRVRIGVGLITVCVAILSSLQTFLRFAERAERHRAAGARYGAIKRAIEQAQAVPPPPGGETQDFVAKLRGQLDTLASESPEIANRVWLRTEKWYESRAKDVQQVLGQHTTSRRTVVVGDDAPTR